MTSQSFVNSRTSTAAAGIGLMLLGCFMFSLNDTLGKWLLGTFSVGQVMLIRSIAAFAVLAPFIRREHWDVTRMPHPGLQVLRVTLSSVEVGLFYWAVSYLPLADVVTFYLAGPIFVTAFSVLLLQERVGWRRWTAVAVGFAGVLIALRPSSASFTLPALIALAGSFIYSLFLIVTRAVRGTADLAMVTTQTIATLLIGAVLAPFHWVTPGPGDLALLLLLGIVALAAHAAVNRSLKLAPASLVVPYQYTLILWAMVLGYLVFADVPHALLLAGAAIIVASGTYIFFRERKLAPRRKPVPVEVTPPTS